MKNVILITGASSGIGKETALKLIGEGNIVYGAARRLGAMDDLKTAGGFAIKMDLSDELEVSSAVKRIIDEQGRIDVLVNNGGYADYGSMEEMSIEDAKRLFEVNMFGPGRLIQLVLPYMRKQSSGKIINISAISGKIYLPLGSWFVASKHALEGLSDCLRLETRKFGIDVVIIEPGMIKTTISNKMNDPLIKRSENGPFLETAKFIMKGISKANQPDGIASPPSVVANLISKVIKSKNPKTRYAVGSMAKPLLFLRKILSDRMFDKMMGRRIK